MLVINDFVRPSGSGRRPNVIGIGKGFTGISSVLGRDRESGASAHLQCWLRGRAPKVSRSAERRCQNDQQGPYTCRETGGNTTRL